MTSKSSPYRRGRGSPLPPRVSDNLSVPGSEAKTAQLATSFHASREPLSPSLVGPSNDNPYGDRDLLSSLSQSRPQSRSRSRSPLPSKSVTAKTVNPEPTLSSRTNPNAFPKPPSTIKLFLREPSQHESSALENDSSESDAPFKAKTPLGYPKHGTIARPRSRKSLSPLPTNHENILPKPLHSAYAPPLHITANNSITSQTQKLSRIPTIYTQVKSDTSLPITTSQALKSARSKNGSFFNPSYALEQHNQETPYPALMRPKSSTGTRSGTGLEWNRYEATPSRDSSGVLDLVDKLAPAPEKSLGSSTLRHDKSKVLDIAGPGYVHLHTSDDYWKSTKYVEGRRSPSPPNVSAPPPSPADPRKTQRQRSQSNIKQNPSLSLPETRPRSKSTSESRDLSPMSNAHSVPDPNYREDARLNHKDLSTTRPSYDTSHSSLISRLSPASPASRHTQALANPSVNGKSPELSKSYDSPVARDRILAAVPTSYGRSNATRTSRVAKISLNTSSPSSRPTTKPISIIPAKMPNDIHYKNKDKKPKASRNNAPTDHPLAKPISSDPMNTSPRLEGDHAQLSRLIGRSSTTNLTSEREVDYQPLTSNMVKRLSLLRRITTSPFPEDLGPEDNLSHSEVQTITSSQSSSQDSSEPLYMTLSDALVRPYHYHGIQSSSRLGRTAELHQRETPNGSVDPMGGPDFYQVDRNHSSSPVLRTLSHPYQREKSLSSTMGKLEAQELSVLPSMGSDLSSILSDERRISDGDTSISGAAEELFKSLGRHKPSRFPPYSSHASTAPRINDPDATPRIPERQIHHTQPHTTELDAEPEIVCDYTPPTWRDTVTDEAYQTLLARYDIFEMRRQEVIWELCRSESQFVELLQTILRLFVQPLRAENDTQWIPGLDQNVAKLFDWLDDIAQLHTDMLSTMQGCRINQLPIVVQIGESLRPFVSRLELYQPYLVRLDETMDSIRQMIHDPQSDLGEFVRIQMASPDCPGSLLELLQKPGDRLLKYPVYFKQLFELTPRNHEDHLGMFSLLHGTDMMIRVLLTVKAREAEYATIKALAGRIQGIPHDFHLASRERRLIGQGPLLRVHLDQPPDDFGHMPEIDYGPGPSSPSFNGRFPHPFRATADSQPLGRDNRPIFTRSAHIKEYPDTKYSSAPPWNLPSQNEPFLGHLSHDLNTHADYVASSVPKADQFFFPEGKNNFQTTPEWVYAFVFTDVVVLARHSQIASVRSSASDLWELLPDVGISRVLGFRDVSGGKHDHLLSVELLPLEHNRSFPSQPPSIPVYLSLAERNTGRMSLAPSTVLDEARKRWSSVFSRCYVYTMRSLAFPASYDTRLVKKGSHGFETPPSILSVLSSDRPLPKSPSTQLLNRDMEPVEQERQEREWWGNRFQQVLEELSNGTEAEEFGGSTISPPRRSQTESPTTPWDMLDEKASTGKPFGSRPMSILKDSKSKLFKLK